MQDVRWKQRFQNFTKALNQLRDAVKLAQTRALTELEKQGIIQAFEFSHELAWNVLKDYLENKGIVPIIGSKDACRVGFKNGLIQSGKIWMNMIESRNLTSHTYNLDIANSVVDDILQRYYPEFEALKNTFSKLMLENDTIA